MKPKLILCLALVLSISSAQQAHALSTFTQIKTNDLQNATSFIKIKAQDTEGGEKRFRVIVTPYAGIKRENVFGNLDVYQGGKLVVRCNVLSARLPANDKEVDKSVKDKSMMFEFTIARNRGDTFILCLTLR